MIFVALSGAFSSRFPKSSPTKRTSFNNWRGFLENVQFNRFKLKKDKLAACWLRSRGILAWYWEYALCGTVRRNVLGVLLACCRAPSHPQRKRSLVYVEQGVVLPHFSGQSAKGATDIRPAGGPWRVVKVLGWLWHHVIAKCATALRTLLLHISPESLRLQQSNLNKYHLSIHLLYIS